MCPSVYEEGEIVKISGRFVQREKDTEVELVKLEDV